MLKVACGSVSERLLRIVVLLKNTLHFLFSFGFGLNDPDKFREVYPFECTRLNFI